MPFPFFSASKPFRSKRSNFQYSYEVDAPPPSYLETASPEGSSKLKSSHGIPFSTVVKPRTPRQLTTEQRTMLESAGINPKQLEQLRAYDTVFILDDSGSMLCRVETGATRWDVARQTLETVAGIAGVYDDDGFSIRFLNQGTLDSQNLQTEEDVADVFERTSRPDGGTPLAGTLELCLETYMREYRVSKESTKRLNLIVITDGIPDNEREVERVIVKYARQLDPIFERYQIGIQFVQIGNEEGATRFLESLDGLKNKAKYSGLLDIVDTVKAKGGRDSCNPQTLLKILMGGFNRAVDAQGEVVNDSGDQAKLGAAEKPSNDAPAV